MNLAPGISFALDTQEGVGIATRGIWAHESKALLLIDGGFGELAVIHVITRSADDTPGLLATGQYGQTTSGYQTPRKTRSVHGRDIRGPHVSAASFAVQCIV